MLDGVMDVVDNGSVPRLVIFDLDGTLYPREKYAELVLELIGRGFVELRGTTPEYAEQKVAELREAMRSDWASTSTTSFVLANGFEVGEWRDFRAVNLAIAAGVSPDDQAVNDLKRLRVMVPIVLLTNNTRGVAEEILDKVGLGTAGFTGVLSAEDVGGTPKPDPGAFRILLETFGAEAQHAWGVGDRYDIDIEPLQRLGGAGICVDGPADLTEAVDFLIERISPRPA
jgi:FMN phosphatase YigB (HAD superfamily)